MSIFGRRSKAEFLGTVTSQSIKSTADRMRENRKPSRTFLLSLLFKPGLDDIFLRAAQTTVLSIYVPPDAFGGSQSFVPVGKTSKLRPPPSSILYFLAFGFAFSISLIVSGMMSLPNGRIFIPQTLVHRTQTVPQENW